MPKYTNSGTTVVTIGDVRIEPGQSVKTLQFIPGSLPAGITEDAYQPMINPIISSTKLTSTGTVTVPETYTNPATGLVESLTGNYLISVYVATGDCTVIFNTSGSTARYVGLYEKFDFRCATRTVDNIVITISSGTVYVTITAI